MVCISNIKYGENDTDLIIAIRKKIDSFKKAGYKGIPVVSYDSNSICLFSDKLTSNFEHICGYGTEISDNGDIRIEIADTPVGRVIQDSLLQSYSKPFSISINGVKLSNGNKKIVNCILE